MSLDNGRVPQAIAQPMIVSVMSGKGGVGKSVISYNLAERIAACGFRALAVDVDLLAGNLHILANVASERGLDQYLRREANLGQAVTVLKPNFGLLARTGFGPFDSKSLASESTNLVNRLRNEGASYDFIIIDHGSGMSTISANIASASDLCLIVVVPELTSIADGYGLYKFLHNQSPEVECQLLINRARSSADAEYLAERFVAMAEQFLGSAPRLFGWIGEHLVVPTSVAQQSPISQIDQKSAVCQQVRGLADKLVEERRQRRLAGAGLREVLASDPITPTWTINNNAATADIKG